MSFKKLSTSKKYSTEIDNDIQEINKQIDALNKKISIMNSDNKVDELENLVSNMTISEKSKKEESIFYTDGSCTKNGKKCSSGGLGIFIYKSNIGDKISIGRKLEYSAFAYKNKKYEYDVTNIRTEGYAIIYSMFIFKLKCLDKINIDKNNVVKILNTHKLPELNNLKELYNEDELKIKSSKPSTIRIVTDSKFWMDVCTNWVDNWIRQNKLLTYKNIDILLYLYYFKTLFSQNKIILHFQHVKAHQKGPNLDIHAVNNNIVDEIAVKAHENINHYDFCYYE